MSRRNRLFLVTLIALVVASAAYGQNWVSELNLSLGEYSRKIALLSFDSNSNISSYQASRVMDGFFSGIASQGSYRIDLSREFVEDKSATFFGTFFGLLSVLTPLSWVGVPCVTYEYKLTACIEIRDLSGTLVQTVTKSETYDMAYNAWEVIVGDADKTITNLIEKSTISKIFSRLIRQARNELNYEATAINNQLKSAAQPFDKKFDELSANLRGSTSVAILPISGSDTAENNRVLGELTRYFVNSSKNHAVVNREHIDKVVAEIAFQRSLFVDQNTAVQIGKFVGAQVIIVGSVDSTNNGKQLVMHAIDVETGRTIGTSVAVY